MGKNISINSQLFMSSNEKNETKLRKTEKTWKNKTNSLKPLESELQANIRDINSSSSDDEEGAEY